MRHSIPLYCILLLVSAHLPNGVLGATHYFSSTMDTSNWMSIMKDKIYNYTLPDITIPGTHDSGTYQLQAITGPGQDHYLDELIQIAKKLHIPVYELIENWSRTQNTSLYDQLMGGIRYIDLRACWILNDWYTQHFVIGSPTQVLLNQIQGFISTHPGEVIVVELGDFDGSNAEQQVMLFDMINKTLGPWLALVREGGLESFTIGQMVELNQRIIMICPDFVDAYIQNSTLYNYLWNKTIYKDVLSDMIAWNTEEIFTQGGPELVFAMSWTLTPTPSDIVKRILDPFDHVKNLKDMAVIADGALTSFIQKYL